MTKQINANVIGDPGADRPWAQTDALDAVRYPGEFEGTGRIIFRLDDRETTSHGATIFYSGGQQSVRFLVPPEGGAYEADLPPVQPPDGPPVRLTYAEAPPVPQPPLPKPTHPIDFGYMVARSYQGNYAREAFEVGGNLDIMWTYYGDSSPDRGWIAAQCQDKVLGTQLVFGPNVGPNTRSYADAAAGVEASVRAAKLYWRRVSRDYFDEFGHDANGLTEWLSQYKAFLRGEGLSPRETMVNFSYEQVMQKDLAGEIEGWRYGWESPAIDLIGIEAYVDPADQNAPNVDVICEQRIREQIAYIRSRRLDARFFLIIQGYNRNGQWTNLDSLRRIQTVPYLVAHDDPWIEELWIFAYVREGGGSKELGLTAEHRRIWEAIQS